MGEGGQALAGVQHPQASDLPAPLSGLLGGGACEDSPVGWSLSSDTLEVAVSTGHTSVGSSFLPQILGSREEESSR